MGKIIFELDDELEERFRKVVVETKGLHKGVIKESLKEAIQLWIKTYQTESSREKKHE